MLLIAAACLLAAVAVWAGAFHVAPFQSVDAKVLEFATGFDDTPVELFSETIVHLIEPLVYAAICAAIVLIGWRAAGPWRALQAAVAIAGANVTTQLLKLATAVPRPHDESARQVVAESWPSGHATAATVATLAALMVLPPRAVAVAGGLLTAGVCVAVVVNNWHYPSDALGGIAVAGAWAATVSSLRRPAATTALRRRWPRATG